MLLLLGLVLGVAVAGVALFFVEYADRSIRGIINVKRHLGLPVLGAIPFFFKNRNRVSVRKRFDVTRALGWSAATAAVTLLVIAFVFSDDAGNLIQHKTRPASADKTHTAFPMALLDWNGDIGAISVEKNSPPSRPQNSPPPPQKPKRPPLQKSAWRSRASSPLRRNPQMNNSNLDRLNALFNRSLHSEPAREGPAVGVLEPPRPREAATPRENIDTKKFWESIRRVSNFDFSPECAFSHSSEIGEKFRELRANLQTLQVDKGVKIVVFSSAHHNEGKTHTAVNTARFMAQNQSRRVLLIDCDLRRPNVKNHIAVHSEKNLEDVLMGRCELADTVVYSEQDNLALLQPRHGMSNATEALETPVIKNVLALARRAFDFIFIDTSPLLSTTDPLVLSAMSDGVILVVRAGFTQRESVEHAISLIYQSNAKVLGVVLSQMKNYIPKYLYRYHYFNDLYSDYYNVRKKT